RCRRHSLTTSDREVATALGQAIARLIGEPRYRLWFHRNTKFTWADDLLVVGVPNHFYQEWLENTFADAVRNAAREVLGAPMRVRFTIDPELFQAARREQQALSAKSEHRPAAAALAERGTASPHDLPTDVDSPPRPRPASPRAARRWHR